MAIKTRSYKSIKEAAKAADVPYMTFYMRIRNGWKGGKAFKKPVRVYNKRINGTIDWSRAL